VTRSQTPPQQMVKKLVRLLRVELSSSPHLPILPLSFIIAEGTIGEEARNEDHRPH
jgi:hypothetical protein